MVSKIKRIIDVTRRDRPLVSHKLYKVNDIISKHGIKEYRKIPGIRPDFVDLDNYIIYELKPANKNSILRGYKQLDKYKYLFDKYRPVRNGEWQTILELY